MPRNSFAPTFANWGNFFGIWLFNIPDLKSGGLNIISYSNVLGAHFIILNTLDPMKELLEKRKSTYSDRPCFLLAGELMGGKENVALGLHGDDWKRRKCILRGLSGRTAKEFWDVQTDFRNSFLRRIHKHPDHFVSEIRL